jgi:hypothetical protein
MPNVHFEYLGRVPVTERPREIRIRIFGIEGRGSLKDWAIDALATLGSIAFFYLAFIYISVVVI